MGPIFVIVAAAILCVIAGATLFGILALAAVVFRIKNRSRLLLAGAVAIATLGAVCFAGFLVVLFGGLPDSPRRDFREIFDREPPPGLVVLQSKYSAGSDYNDTAIQFRIDEKSLRAFVVGWKPGEVHRSHLPNNENLPWNLACKDTLSFYNDSHSGHSLAYSAVLYCRDDRVARAVYVSID
jgi:hypothetical protein